MERARHSIYALIHKALRLAMIQSLTAAGKLDVSDAQEVSDAIVRVRELLRFCRMHLHAEETFIHPAIDARRPGVVSRIAGEHVEHVAAIGRQSQFQPQSSRCGGEGAGLVPGRGGNQQESLPH